MLLLRLKLVLLKMNMHLLVSYLKFQMYLLFLMYLMYLMNH